MKRIYKTTTIRPNGVEVSVRQVLGRGQERVPTAIQEAAIKARQWLSAALLADPRTDSRVASIFRHCFLSDGSSADVSTVKAVLTTLNNSLSRSYAVKVNTDNDGTLGYVKRSYDGRPHLVNGMNHFDSDGDQISRRGEIHVCLLAIDKGNDMATITLIHEAAHKFANLRDHGNRGYFDNNNRTYCTGGLTHEEALLNADSYAVFCYKVAKARGLIRSEEVDEDLSEAMGSLFG
jgi:hypothetical protein